MQSIINALPKIGKDIFGNAGLFISAISDTVNEHGILRKLSCNKPSFPQKKRGTEHDHFVLDTSDCDSDIVEGLMYDSIQNQIQLEDKTLITELLGQASKNQNIVTYKTFTYPTFEKLCGKLPTGPLDIIVSSSVWTQLFSLAEFVPNTDYNQVILGIMGTIDIHTVYSDVFSTPVWHSLNNDAIIAVPKNSIHADWSDSKLRITSDSVNQECRVSLELTASVAAALQL